MRFVLALCLVSTLTAAVRAEGDWVDFFSVGPFECRSEFKLDDSQKLRLELQQLKSDVESTLKLKPVNTPVQINLFRNRRSYFRHVSKRFPAGAKRQALYLQGTDMGRIYVYRHSKCRTDILHEACHAILHNDLPYLPIWLDEGFAEYFEVPPNQRLDKHPHLGGLRWRIRFGWKPRLHALEKKRGLNDMRAADYRESWAWVHFMLHGPREARQVLADYLNSIQDADPPGFLSAHLERRLPNAERRLVQHLKDWGNKSQSRRN